MGLIVFIVFLIFKLVGILAWSWWWIFTPLMAEAVVDAIIIFVLIVFFAKSIEAGV